MTNGKLMFERKKRTCLKSLTNLSASEEAGNN